MNLLSQKLHCNITNREMEVLDKLANGLTCGEIGDILNISSTTVITHRNNLKEKLSVNNTAHLVYCACKLQLI